MLTQQIWNCVQDWLKAEVGKDSFESWLAPLEVDFANASEAELNIFVPTRFMYDWVLRHYSTLIERGIHQALEATPQIHYHIKAAAPKPEAPQAQKPQPIQQPEPQPAPESMLNPMPAPTPAPKPVAPKKVDESRYEGNALDPMYTFDNFVVGKSNEFAHAAAKRIAENDDLSYNPFILQSAIFIWWRRPW